MFAHLPTACVRIAALVTALAVAAVMVTVVKNLGTGSGNHVQAFEEPSMMLLTSVCLADDVEDALDDVVLNESSIEPSCPTAFIASRKPWLTPYHADERPHRPPIR